MPRHKDFTGGTKITDFEPLTFSLNKQDFTAKPAIQGSTILDFVSRADGDSGGAAAGALYSFFESVLEEAEYKRFMGVLNDPDVIIDMALIGEIASWLIEEYSDRPTEQPEPSANGR